MRATSGVCCGSTPTESSPPTTVPVQSVAGGNGRLSFLPDPEMRLRNGDILIVSEARAAHKPGAGAGGRTRRIATVHSSRRTTTSSRRSPMRTRATFSGPRPYRI